MTAVRSSAAIPETTPARRPSHALTTPPRPRKALATASRSVLLGPDRYGGGWGTGLAVSRWPRSVRRAFPAAVEVTALALLHLVRSGLVAVTSSAAAMVTMKYTPWALEEMPRR
jgi:hypothetical protein